MPSRTEPRPNENIILIPKRDQAKRGCIKNSCKVKIKLKLKCWYFHTLQNQTTLTFELVYMIPVNLWPTNRQFHTPSRFIFNKRLLREWSSYVRRKNDIYWSNLRFLLRHMYNTLIVERWWMWREKDRGLTQTYDKKPYTNRKFENQWTTHKRHQNLRLHNDCWLT